MTYGATSPRLMVIEPESLRGQVISVMDGWTTVGRGEVNMRLNDPYVSQRHAALYAADGQVTVEDLGSKAGTTVNNQPVHGRQPLRSGDVLGFGRVRVRYEIAAAPQQTTGASFDVKTQTGHTISNVGRDQYNYMVQQRESFLREVAATRTRARRLVTFGLIVFVAAAGVEIAWLIVYANQFQSVNEQSDTNSLFKSFTIAFMAAGISAFGLILTIVGIILHVVATSRQRRVNENFPIRPPS